MKSKLKSLVLLSAGLDSTVNLFLAREKTEVLRAVTFDYGQRAAIKELSCARTLAQALQIDHQVISLPFFKEFQNSSLLNSQLGIPVGAQIEIDDLKTSQKSAQSVWVPNRLEDLAEIRPVGLGPQPQWYFLEYSGGNCRKSRGRYRRTRI